IFLDYSEPKGSKSFAGAGRAETAYAGAFPEYGLDLERLEVNAAARRIDGSAIRSRLLAALEHWAFVKARADRPGWEHLLAIANGVDSDPWRRQLREAWVRRNLPALQRLIAETDLGQLSQENLVALGRTLGSADQSPDVLQALREVQRRVPNDFSTNYVLSARLFYATTPKEKAESVAFLRAAVAQRPNSVFLRINLASTLRDLGELNRDPNQLQEAVATFHEALRLNPKHSIGHGELGWTLWLQGKKTHAVEE